MRFGTRIFSFLAVGFLLSFFGKVSKVDLFHVYIRTIQDVSDRNSTEIPHYQDQLTAPAPMASAGSAGLSLFSQAEFSTFSFVPYIRPCIATPAQALFASLIQSRYLLTSQFSAAP